MRQLRILLLSLGCFVTLSSVAGMAPPTAPPSRFYELRIYYSPPGKHEAIVDRFRQYTTKLFEKHGMENIGYWVPTDTTQKALYYILAFPSRAARDSSWKAFGSDPDWKAVVAKTEANGKIVQRIESIFLTEADISPQIRPKRETPVRTFELRTYTAPPGKMPNLLTRFRNHSRKLLRKHGMENIGYWLTDEKEGTQPKLLYILAHPGEAEGKQHWNDFRNDKRWIRVKADSETEAGGSLTTNVESLFLKPTDYSPMQ